MIRPKSAVVMMEEALLPATYEPLMLETFLAAPVLSWMGRHLLAEGVQRLFLACDPRFADKARSQLPPELPAVISDRREDLLSFLDTPDTVLVLTRSALPLAEAGAGFAYAAPGRELREVWRERLSNAVQGAELVSGWLPVYGPETLAELEEVFRSRGLGPEELVPGGNSESSKK